MTCSRVNYLYPTVHYIPRTYLTYNWSFAPFDPLRPIPPPSTPPNPRHWEPQIWSLEMIFQTPNLWTRKLSEARAVEGHPRLQQDPQARWTFHKLFWSDTTTSPPCYQVPPRWHLQSALRTKIMDPPNSRFQNHTCPGCSRQSPETKVWYKEFTGTTFPPSFLILKIHPTPKIKKSLCVAPAFLISIVCRFPLACSRHL